MAPFELQKVAPKPRPVSNSQGCPLFSCGNGLLFDLKCAKSRCNTDVDFYNLDLLLTFDEPRSISNVKNIHIPDLTGWAPSTLSFWERHPSAHKLASRLVIRLYRAYFENRLLRTIGDKIGLTS